MARGAISTLDTRKAPVKYMAPEDPNARQAYPNAFYTTDPNDPGRVVFRRGQWPASPTEVARRNKEAIMTVFLKVPRWFMDLLPSTPRAAIMCAAVIRGTRLAHRVKWGVVEWYKDQGHIAKALEVVDNVSTILRFKPDEYLALIHYQRELCIPTLPLATLSAMLVGLNIMTAHWGITAPARSYPFTRREWKTLLRITNMPYTRADHTRNLLKGIRRSQKARKVGIHRITPEIYYGAIDG